eukprot:TRINITY_DN9054_c0_g1_i1.p1 TRINITY_DN9054_c0_g1~~TRINITY_DN9054_c0_g1_i1.p1  ORF type:complete len:321 (+),score=26.19 TRINITY_DN9054_c0_g1_i1:80-1042(+)
MLETSLFFKGLSWQRAEEALSAPTYRDAEQDIIDSVNANRRVATQALVILRGAAGILMGATVAFFDVTVLNPISILESVYASGVSATPLFGYGLRQLAGFSLRVQLLEEAIFVTTNALISRLFRFILPSSSRRTAALSLLAGSVAGSLACFPLRCVHQYGILQSTIPNAVPLTIQSGLMSVPSWWDEYRIPMWLLLTTSVVGNTCTNVLMSIFHFSFIQEHKSRVSKSAQDDYALYRDTGLVYASRIFAKTIIELVFLPANIYLMAKWRASILGVRTGPNGWHWASVGAFIIRHCVAHYMVHMVEMKSIEYLPGGPKKDS